MKLASCNLACRAATLGLFLLPVGYLALLFATVVHELVGHGLTALALGGHFDRFIIHWDGMGWAAAYAHRDAPRWHEAVILAGGVISTLLFGAALLAVSTAVRPLLARMVVLLLAICCLLEAGPYMLWNAYHPVPPGDIAKILAMMDWPEGRWLILAAGALITAGAAVVCGLALFRAMEAWLTSGGQLIGTARLLVIALFLVVPGVAGWWLFDWDQLAPGIGAVPNVAGSVLMLMVGLIAYFWDCVGRHSRLTPG